MLILKNIEAFRTAVLAMHDEARLKGIGHQEFSWMTYYDRVTGEWDTPQITDSVNDTAVTTTSVISGAAAVEMARRMSENPNLIYVWGHSHVNMGVHPSAQDINTVKENELAVSVISNNRGELNIMLYIEGDVYEITKNSGYTYNATNYKGSRKRKANYGRSKSYASVSNDDYDFTAFDDGFSYEQYFPDYEGHETREY